MELDYFFYKYLTFNARYDYIKVPETAVSCGTMAWVCAGLAM